VGDVNIVIAGGHGQIARRLTLLLVARGDEVTALVRNPDHVQDVSADGATAVVIDLEAIESSATDGEAPDTLDEVLTGADAVVFAAGAGPGSGAERKRSVDFQGAATLVDAAARSGCRRFVMVSAMGTDRPPQDDEVFSVYLRAKADADTYLRAAGLDHTIVRPGGLTDEPGTGRVQVARQVDPGAISRDDVAAVLAAVLHEPSTAGRTFQLVAGDTPVEDAAAVVSGLDPDS